MIETMRETIKEQYGRAASEGASLCSTDAYRGLDLSWIPDEILTINQGCGSPLSDASHDVRRGEVIADLGSGGGLDVFLASKMVGPNGFVHGIDMTPEMLAVSRRNQDEVARRLGYPRSNVAFHEGHMEEIPLESGSVDTVISNCVINLSHDKDKVFREIHRVLKPGGRFLISDILSLRPLPLYMKNNDVLVGRCLGGAQAVGEFLQSVDAAGFRGTTLLNQKSYASVDMHDFVSLTVVGYKPAAVSGASQYAVLIGPCSSVVDETGTRYDRGAVVEVPAETAAMLKLPRYREYFFVSPQPREIKGPAQRGVLPDPGPCIYAGDFATLLGPFREVRDDDGHVFEAGAELEICGKTTKVLSTALYRQIFVMVNRCQGELAARQVSCGPGSGCC
jgi:SAM-dependent methyltransferase